MMYGAQMSVDKTIGVDTAKYTLQINNKEDTIYTGADGACGIYHRLKHGLNPHTFFDAIIIHLEFSSDLDSIQGKKKVTFKYMEFAPDKTKKEKHDGQLYVFSPYVFDKVGEIMAQRETFVLLGGLKFTERCRWKVC